MIFIDLDGVVADLHKVVWDLHGLDINQCIPGEWHAYKAYPGMTDEKMWGDQRMAPASFWADLPKTPWADELMDLVSHYFKPAEQCFLTKPLPNSASAAGKQAWIERHYPQHHYLIGGGKHFCASPQRVLLDDADHNCDAFVAHGGHAITFPRRWNSLHATADPLAHVANELERLKEQVFA